MGYGRPRKSGPRSRDTYRPWVVDGYLRKIGMKLPAPKVGTLCAEPCRSCGGELHIIEAARKGKMYHPLNIVRCDSCGWLWWAK